MTIPFLAWPASALWGALLVIGPAQPFTTPTAPQWIIDIRRDFSDAVSRFGGDGAALLPGLVLGDTSQVSESLTNAMRVSSLAHLTAVSGANCAVIVGLLYGLCALARLGIWWRASVSLAGLGAFVVLVGAEPSVIRASIMATIGLASIAFGRPAAGSAVLSGAVLVALAVAPSLARSIGFALSVAATLGLLLLARPLQSLLARWLPPNLALVVAVPLAAQIAVQPLLLVFSPSLSTYGVFSNILAAPLAPVATVAGLLALLTSAIPILTLPFLGIAWIASAAIAFIARTAAGLPWATLPWPVGWWGIVIAAFATVGLAWAVLSRRGAVAVIAGAVIAGAMTSTVGGTAVAWTSAPPNWSIAQCDVGQGDALVVRDGESVALIDVGRDERLLRSCLERLGIDHINLLVLTHFDVDHAGAYRVVLGKVGTVLHGPPDGGADDRTLAALAHSGATLTWASRGFRGTLGERNWRVLWPTETANLESGNPSSVVVEFSRCASGCPSLLGLGDLPAREQEQMLALGGIRPVDVVKVSHHGSRDQSSELYRRLKAPVALIGVGVDNEYGHPTSETLALLAAVSSTTVRSDQSGIALIAAENSQSIRVWSERARDANVN